MMLQDTIAAIATAPGEAGVSVIRVSGGGALQLLQKVFVNGKMKPLQQVRPRYVYYGYVVEGETPNQEAGETAVLDEALAIYMPGPHSYTGEDVVEIQCHGGFLASHEILKLLLHHGAQMANPGEFTQRAFLNGKLNLTQAEAIIDVIQAKSKAALQLSEKQLQGALGQKVAAAADQLLDLLAQMEVAIDYPEEADDLWETLALPETLGQVLAEVQQLLAGAEQGKLYREGALTAIIGPANAGKSTLLNAFLQEERAIVTAVAGTTRDTIEEYYTINGLPLKLVDTAGFRETADEVEQQGIRRSEKAMAQADLILLVLDGSQPLPAEWQERLQTLLGRPLIVVLNKMDQVADAGAAVESFTAAYPQLTVAPVAAKTGQGIEELQQTIFQTVLGKGLQPQDLTGLINGRQKSALERAAAHLQEALQGLAAGMDGDMVAIDIQNAWQALGEITGQQQSEEIIDRIFSRFCLGK